MSVKAVAAVAALLTFAAVAGRAQSPVPAAYFEGTVKEMPEKKAGKLSLSGDDSLEFTWDKGSWKVPLGQVKTVYLALSRHSVLGEVFGLTGAAIGATKKRKLLLSLILTDGTGKSRRCVFYLPQAVTRDFLEAVEKKSGRKVVYESEEARKATAAT
jgi:hypothetical protein